MDLGVSKNTVLSNWNKICRICLTHEQQVYPILSTEEQFKMTLCDMLNKCTNIKVSVNDCLPQVVCVNCITHLCNSLLFKTKCETSNTWLQKLQTQKLYNDLPDNACSETEAIETEYLLEDIKEETAEENSDIENNDEECTMFNTSEYIDMKDESNDADDLNNQLKCTKCEMTFDNFRSLFDHKFVAHGIIVTCLRCGIDFDSKENFKIHLRSHTNLVCHKCSMVFKNSSTFKLHMTSHITEYKCTICGIVYNKLSLLAAHSATHIKKKFKCGQCDLKFKYLRNMQIHEKSHENLTEVSIMRSNVERSVKQKRINIRVRPYECSLCGNKFTSKSCLKKHEARHMTEPKRFACPCCNKRLSSVKSVSRHMEIHKCDGKFLCSTCNKTFAEPKELGEHMKTHPKLEKVHLCMICGNKFANPDTLKSHLRIHSGEKKFSCQYCNLRFLHRNSMKNHIITVHTKERKYVCNVCNKRFARSGGLREHKRIHTGEKPFPCPICGMHFRRSTELKNHTYVHTGEKKVFCQLCDKGFISNFNLKTHMVTHTGERKHVCLICKKAYTQAHVLRGHMKTHSDPVVCKLSDITIGDI